MSTVLVETKVVVYGLSTEGYHIAGRMALRGATVSIVDESAHMAISMNSDIAKTYPDVSALKDDEPLMGIEPTDVAISECDYLFFAPRIRKTGQEIKTELTAQLKDATQSIKKGTSVVYNVPTGLGGNNENVSLLEHVTGLQVGQDIFYYYYPIGSKSYFPDVVGSFNLKTDSKLSKLLSEDGKKEKRFLGISASEIYHSVRVLSEFSNLSSMLEICKFAKDESIRKDLNFDKFSDMYLDDMTNDLYDLKCLGATLEGTGNLMYIVNGSLKGIDGYIKRLIDDIRNTLKRNELKPSRTRIAITWTLDSNEMRGDKIEMLNSLVLKLRDYIADVETYESDKFDHFHSEKTTIVIACSKKDYDTIDKKSGRQSVDEHIKVKTNPLCEILQ